MRKPPLWRWVENVLHEKQHRLVIGGGIGCFLLLSLLAMAGERGFFEVYRYSRHLQRVEDRIRTLEEKNKRLRRQVTGLRSDPYQVEKLAREDLGLARPDEIIFEIVDDRPQDALWPGGQRKE
ncbi:MAG: FtsB family cell division protein [Candidatus Entotheonellia bacterium]